MLEVPCPADTAADAWKAANKCLCWVLYFATTASAHIAVKAHKGKTIGSSRDGAAAWNALQDRFDGNTKEARRALREQLHKKKMKIGDDPTDFIATMEDLWFCLKGVGEEISDEFYTCLHLDALTPEFQFVKDKSYELGDAFDYELLTRLVTNYFINQQSRKPSAPPLAERGAAMAATAFSTDQCQQSKAYGHFKRDCTELVKKSRPKRGKTKRKKGGGGNSSPKWCSLHKANSHSDAECHKRRELQQLRVNLALLIPQDQAGTNIGSAHLARAPQLEPPTREFSSSAMGASLAETAASAADASTAASAESSAQPAAPASAVSGSAQPSHHWSHGVVGAFMAAGTKQSMTDLCRLVITMMVDSGATDNLIDPHPIPRLQEFMNDFKVVTVPHMVSADGGHVCVATGTVHGTVTDDGGNEQYVSFSVVVVPGLGTNLLSVTTPMQRLCFTRPTPYRTTREGGDYGHRSQGRIPTVRVVCAT